MKIKLSPRIETTTGWGKPFTPDYGTFNRYMRLFYKTDDKVYESAYMTASCKAYLDQCMAQENGWTATRSIYGATSSAPTGFWKGLNKPLIVGYSTPKKKDDPQLTLEVIRLLEKELGVKTTAQLCTHEYGPHLVLFRVSKKWMSSSYAFSFLTWMIRACETELQAGDTPAALIARLKGKNYQSIMKAFQSWTELGLPRQVAAGDLGSRASNIHNEGAVQWAVAYGYQINALIKQDPKLKEKYFF